MVFRCASAGARRADGGDFSRAASRSGRVKISLDTCPIALRVRRRTAIAMVPRIAY